VTHAAVLAAVSEPMRWRILELLTGGDATASALAAHVPISRQAVIKHLRVLDGCGLVSGRRVGNEVRFTAHPERLAATAAWMARAADAWDRRLAALKLLAEAPEPPAGVDAPG
jgi:DNA-binding transcriptional ArsR family regulator